MHLAAHFRWKYRRGAPRIPNPSQAKPSQAKPSQANELTAFIHINATGNVDLIVPAVEMGQGSQTGLAMILADELGLPWERVTIRPPPLDRRYNTPGRPIQSTSGSYTVRRCYTPLRKAAASAHEALIDAAAAQWGVTHEECQLQDGFVEHPASSRRLDIAVLAADAQRFLTEEPRQLLDRKIHIGKSIPRFDLPAKVDGSAIYGVDVRLPEMVYAAIRQSPVFGETLTSFDAKDVKSRPGIIEIVRLPNAVVADRFWRAKQAVEDIEVEFSKSSNGAVDSARIAQEQLLGLGDRSSKAEETLTAPASVDTAPDETRVQQDYSTSFLYHAPMEPMNCTVRLSESRCEVWVPTQNITAAAADARLPS
ncbi:molybdopterin cofactor-binding domain-containing protein [Bradyrhizobium sp. 6(2017)]|uniref:molybdopterin cofactor-binding domain-containing protein n=1 Tax=Bradyrhizobium sp. 6(2017) TaxID=1197460 RepID=UPI002FE57018